MAKNDNLKDFVTDVANAIRAKKGTTDLINPQDFAAEIDAISGGSGEGGGGGSTIEYLDISGMEDKTFFVMMAVLVKVDGRIVPPGLLTEYALGGVDAFWSIVSTINQIAIDGTLEINLGYGKETIKEQIDSSYPQYDSIPRITKEQFYSLD